MDIDFDWFIDQHSGEQTHILGTRMNSAGLSSVAVNAGLSRMALAQGALSVVIWGHGRCCVSPNNGLTRNKVAGLRPRLSPYSFVHHKRVCRKRCPTSLPAVGGFPPWNSCFEERQKLRLRLQTFAALFLKSTVSLRLRHTGWAVQNKVKDHTNVAKIA